MIRSQDKHELFCHLTELFLYLRGVWEVDETLLTLAVTRPLPTAKQVVIPEIYLEEQTKAKHDETMMEKGSRRL